MERINPNHIPIMKEMTKKDKSDFKKGYERVCRKYGYPMFDVNGRAKYPTNKRRDKCLIVPSSLSTDLKDI